MRRITGWMAAWLLVAGACSGSSTPATDVARNGSQQAQPEETDEKEPDGVRAKTRAGKKNEKSGRPAAGSKAADVTEGADATGGSSKGRARPLALPARGSYSYVQDGWEEFCQAQRCDRRDLPPQEEMQIRYRGRSARRATFVSKIESGSGGQAITYVVTRQRVLISRVDNDVSYQGFEYSTHLVPDPPIVSALLPLEVGKQWSGAWTDKGNFADGSYRMRVVKEETVSLRGRRERVFVLDITLNFEGDNEGTNETRVWVDPDDLTILSSKGRVDVTSGFGTYRSKFSTAYSSGP